MNGLERVAKTVGGVTRHFHYDLEGNLLGEFAPGGVLRAYVYVNGERAALLEFGAGGPSGIFYFHNDHLGTPKALTDKNGKIKWQAAHTPFGTALVSLDKVENNLRFPGQYFDEETGLHYNYFRDYDPGTGRYIESDPAGLAGRINPYNYVNSNPITLTDPFGLVACDGQWERIRWVRDPFSGFTYRCTCYWSCFSCPASGKGDAFPIPNPGQFRTKGAIFFNAGRSGKDFDPEGGNDCLCSAPGPEKRCNECEK